MKLYGYQAPSTAHENRGDPLLEIGGNQDIDMLSPLDFLPEKLILKLRMCPVLCKPGMVEVLYEGQDFPLYTDDLPLEAIDLKAEDEAFYELRGETFPLTLSSPFRCASGLASRFLFTLPEKQIRLSPDHPEHPYGGQWHWNPNLCHPLYFTIHEEGETLIKRITHESSRCAPSLGEALKSRGVQVKLYADEQSYSYRSIHYTIQDRFILFVEFTL